ncbi:MAG: hypothetical protein LQ342_000742 [Letrouitia transgressa]|nr:MAG: hypothetical protein LQ342_000742 [Letrouitia transgressa]
MATCHSLRLVGAELLGDPMDLKMFEFTGWSFDEFQADSHAVPGQGRNNTGASVARPPVGVNFADHDADRSSPKLHQRQSLNLQEIKRIDVESGLDFIGFIIFENKLKNATKKVISELADANIRNVMCTGDNILTAISVGRECGLIDTTAHCFVPHFTKGDFRDPEARLKWQSVDNPVFELDEGSLLPLPTPASSDVSLPYDVANLRNFSLAITGDVFRWIVEHGDERSLQRMLVAGQIFARMSPDEKHELVEKLQSINYCCSFCGDGANDCGALKAADVGISLSEAEASVAAPFTSRVFDISCVPEVIREGRAALVTSFCCFKYMSLYSAIQFISVSFLYIPPKLNTEESNIENSQNTTLFLISCFQYILSAVLLSAGPPFRQPMSNNGPFVVTVVVALLFSLYMLLDPNRWLTSLMQLTDMSLAFKVYILASALGGFAVALVAERYVFHWIARGVGVVRDMIRPHRRKKRKLYKQILEGLRI